MMCGPYGCPTPPEMTTPSPIVLAMVMVKMLGEERTERGGEDTDLPSGEYRLFRLNRGREERGGKGGGGEGGWEGMLIKL